MQMQSKLCKRDGNSGGADGSRAASLSLPEDIILEVLLRLPAKALRRFRCVCKRWHALISDPAFVAAQRSHAGRLVVGMFGSCPNYELRVLDMRGNVLRVFEVKECARALAPTRLDLICVDRARLGALIIDPAAGHAFTIGKHVRAESIWWRDFSFGRATPSGAYKVLVLGVYKTYTTLCAVATITDGAAEPTWRQRPLPDLAAGFYHQHKATVNGVLYFLSLNTYESPPRWNRVAAFDLETEEWMETINGPPLGLEAERQGWHIALTELNGTLCMIQYIQRDDFVGDLCLNVNVWRLIDYNKSTWVKAYTVRMPAECLHVKVLDVLDDGRVLLLNKRQLRSVLQFFNPNTEAFTDIMEMAEGFSDMTFYAGSLLSS